MIWTFDRIRCPKLGHTTPVIYGKEQQHFRSSIEANIQICVNFTYIKVTTCLGMLNADIFPSIWPVRGTGWRQHLKSNVYLHLVLLFWNQVLTCASVIFRFLAICARSVLARYFWKGIGVFLNLGLVDFRLISIFSLQSLYFLSNPNIFFPISMFSFQFL